MATSFDPDPAASGYHRSLDGGCRARFSVTYRTVKLGAVWLDRVGEPALPLQKFRRPLADDHAGSHGVAGRHPRQDRAVGDAQTVDAVHPQLSIDHRHRIATHPGRSALVPNVPIPSLKKRSRV
jgi:hypothetical protein